MKPAPGTALTVQDIIHIVSKYRRLLIKGTLWGLALSIVAAYVMPYRYKVNFVLAMDPKYFQSPLIRDFVPELTGSADMKSQGETLIRQTLTPEYLDFLGERYHLYSSGKPLQSSSLQKIRSGVKDLLVDLGLYQPGSAEAERSRGRQELLSRFQIFNLYSTTYNVGFIYSNPAVTYQVTQDLYAHVIQNLLELRLQNVISVRDAIQRRLGSMNNLATSSARVSSATPAAPKRIQEELARVKDQIRALTAQYTEDHPAVKELRYRERVLSEQLATARIGGTGYLPAEPSEPLLEGEGGREIYSDLSKKLNYLNIAVDSDKEHQGDYIVTLESPIYPTAPLWPKKGLLTLWGLAFGFLGTLFVAALIEYFDRSALHTSTLAQQLGVTVLGELPVVPWETPSNPLLIGPPLFNQNPRP